MSGFLTTERIAPEEWDQVADWDDTVEAAPAPSVFLTRDWIAAWWKAFGAGLDPCVLRMSTADGRTIGIAPFYRTRLAGTPVRRLGLLGDRVVGSEYLGIIARRGHEDAVAASTRQWLSSPRPKWDLADVSGLRDGDAASDRLVWELGRGGRIRSENHSCAAISLPGDFDEYLAGLNAKFRQRYRQRRNKLLRECDVRFLRTESAADLPRHLETLYALHQSRWTEAGRPGAFADPRMRSFYLDVAERLLRAGRLRFCHLEADGVVRATQFAFAYGGVLHSLQEAYDTGFAPRGVGGLGVVLRGHVLETAIAEGCRSYDFLGGVEDHKLRWGASVHAVHRVRIARPGAAGRLAWVASVGAQSTRDLVKRLSPESVLDTLRSGRSAYHRRRARGASS
jgi:CelD/BcsL family acetyltransferase involved in cellulose biosynthesis